jgi:hypothetical protein
LSVGEKSARRPKRRGVKSRICDKCVGLKLVLVGPVLPAEMVPISSYP